MNKEICQVLINQGADVNKRDKYGFNAGYYAKEKDFRTFQSEFKQVLGPPLKVEMGNFRSRPKM